MKMFQTFNATQTLAAISQVRSVGLRVNVIPCHVFASSRACNDTIVLSDIFSIRMR